MTGPEFARELRKEVPGLSPGQYAAIALLASEYAARLVDACARTPVFQMDRDRRQAS